MNEVVSTLLDTIQVAELLNLSRSTVYKLAASGELPSYKLGGSVRFKEDDVIDWIEKKKRKSEVIENRVREILNKGKSTDVKSLIRREIDSATGS